MNIIPEAEVHDVVIRDDHERTEGNSTLDSAREAEIRRARSRVFSSLARTFSDNPPADILLEHNHHAP